jgi:hypothetical protein
VLLLVRAADGKQVFRADDPVDRRIGDAGMREIASPMSSEVRYLRLLGSGQVLLGSVVAVEIGGAVGRAGLLEGVRGR